MSNRSPQLFETEQTSASQVQDNEMRSLIERKGEAESHSLLGSETSMPEERKATRPGHGWWSEQMLVDRSLCGMAALTSLFAFVIFIISISASPSFSNQLQKNPNSTSIAFQDGTCGSLEGSYQFLKFLINVASTMVLGMSNTYQQLATALQVRDVAYMLSKYGDCRVGTNSPFAINYKRTGRVKAWLCWSFLILTSMPVHLLSNSLVGVSTYHKTPNTVYCPETDFESYVSEVHESGYYYSYNDICSTAFKEGNLTSLAADSEHAGDFGYWEDYFGGSSYSSGSIAAHYNTANCTQGGNLTDSTTCIYSEVRCEDAGSCDKTDEDSENCALVLRMQPAYILTGCLVAKAAYMVYTMWAARGQIKTHLLNFGDAIVVSSLYSKLKIHGECMTSKGDFHRREVKHTCHKHCKDPEPSDTGEDLGHCQNCKKFNVYYNHTRLPWPSLAMKRKRAFLGTLGQTALTQILILCLFSSGAFAGSIVVALWTISEWADRYTGEYPDTPHVKLVVWLSKKVTLAELPLNRISSEIASYMISNGLQSVYSTIYLLLIYNFTLISMEFDWGKLEKYGGRLRCTIVKGRQFNQSYMLQLPKRILFPTMTYSILMHWLLGLSMQTEEKMYETEFNNIFNQYNITLVP